MKPNWFDWLIYRLFVWRWNPLFRNNTKLRRHFLNCWNLWEEVAEDGNATSSENNPDTPAAEPQAKGV